MSTASRTCSSTWRSRAQAAHRRQIAEEIEAVGGDLNRRDQRRVASYYSRVLRADVRWRSTSCPTSLSKIRPSTPRNAARASRHRAGDRRREDAPDDIVFDKRRRRRSPASQSARSILGSRESVKSFDRKRLAAYLSRNYCAPTWWWRLPGGRSPRAGRAGREAVRRLRQAGCPGAGARAFRRWHLYREA